MGASVTAPCGAPGREWLTVRLCERRQRAGLERRELTGRRRRVHASERQVDDVVVAVERELVEIEGDPVVHERGGVDEADTGDERAASAVEEERRVIKDAGSVATTSPVGPWLGPSRAGLRRGPSSPSVSKVATQGTKERGKGTERRAASLGPRARRSEGRTLPSSGRRKGHPGHGGRGG